MQQDGGCAKEELQLSLSKVPVSVYCKKESKGGSSSKISRKPLDCRKKSHNKVKDSSQVEKERKRIEKLIKMLNLKREKEQLAASDCPQNTVQ